MKQKQKQKQKTEPRFDSASYAFFFRPVPMPDLPWAIASG